MLKQSMQDVNKAATLTALSARPAMPSAPDMVAGGQVTASRGERGILNCITRTCGGSRVSLERDQCWRSQAINKAVSLDHI